MDIKCLQASIARLWGLLRSSVRARMGRVLTAASLLLCSSLLLAQSTGVNGGGPNGGGGGSSTLTATQIGYGSATNVLTGTNDLTYTHTTQTISLGTSGATSSAVNILGTSGFTVTGGPNTGNPGLGGNITIIGGANTQFLTTGGSILFQGAQTFNGGAVQITGGTSPSTDGGLGGPVTITSGTAPGSGTAGNVTIGTGVAGTNGSILLQIAGVTAQTINTAGQATFANQTTFTSGVVNNGGESVAGAIISKGTKFTIGGTTGACTTTASLVGGSWAGQFTCTGTAGASRVTINLPATAPNAWYCSASDATSGVAWANENSTATSSIIAGTIATTGDLVTFSCTGY